MCLGIYATNHLTSHTDNCVCMCVVSVKSLKLLFGVDPQLFNSTHTMQAAAAAAALIEVPFQLALSVTQFSLLGLAEGRKKRKKEDFHRPDMTQAAMLSTQTLIFITILE